MRYSIRLSYNGNPYNGWQIQPNGPSVQETLQKALSIALSQETPVTGAGRTDTGVSAVNYIAHFDADELSVPEPGKLTYKLNAILPKSIMVHEIKRERDDFHARFDARTREYRYFLHRRKDPFMEQGSYWCKYRLDLEAMNRAASYLLGTHDFHCFEKTGGNNATSICTVSKASWATYTPQHVRELGYPAEEGDYLVFTVRADRFLRNMVRAIVGTLIDVGRGRHEPEWMESLIDTGTRADAGESVPGNALFFNEVTY